MTASRPASAGQQDNSLPQKENNWFSAARETIRRNEALRPITRPARNVILFIGDGMGISTVTAARILDGQLRGGEGEENVLAWEQFPNVALSKTYNTNQQVPDSAGTATAFMTGVKSKAGVISVDQLARRGDCVSSRGRHVTSFLELAEDRGLATGIVTTAQLTDATPATAYAHVPERYWVNDAAMPVAEKQAGCRDIALQFVEFSHGDGIEVAFGGGRRNFLPDTTAGPEGHKGERKDNRNLIAEWRNKHPKGHYVWNQHGFNDLGPEKTGPVLGLFNAGHMQFEADRGDDVGGEPSLAAMTEKAIRILQQKREGYFLYVEAGRVDHAHHAGNAYRALHDVVALAGAVKMAVAMTDAEETLIIVTADHSHTFVMGGYPTKGNPILGKVVENDQHGEPRTDAARASDDKPYTTVGYYSGPGAKPDQARDDLSTVDTAARNFLQPALIPLINETHGGEDVAIYARGPSAYLFRGVVEENYIFHVMYHATRMGGRVNPAGKMP